MPWTGDYHASRIFQEQEYEGYYKEYDFGDYLENNISSIKICEGITGIGKFPFQGTKATSVSLPSTLNEVDEEAFRDSTWLLSLDNARIWIQIPRDTLVRPDLCRYFGCRWSYMEINIVCARLIRCLTNFYIIKTANRII